MKHIGQICTHIKRQYCKMCLLLLLQLFSYYGRTQKLENKPEFMSCSINYIQKCAAYKHMYHKHNASNSKPILIGNDLNIFAAYLSKVFL